MLVVQPRAHPTHLCLLCCLREWLPHISHQQRQPLLCVDNALGLKHAGDVDAAGVQCVQGIVQAK